MWKFFFFSLFVWSFGEFTFSLTPQGATWARVWHQTSHWSHFRFMSPFRLLNEVLNPKVSVLVQIKSPVCCSVSVVPTVNWMTVRAEVLTCSLLPYQLLLKKHRTLNYMQQPSTNSRISFKMTDPGKLYLSKVRTLAQIDVKQNGCMKLNIFF